MKKSLPMLFVSLLIILSSCERETFSKDDVLVKKKANSMMYEDGTPCGYLDDRDCDGISDNLDNCPDTANPNQEDTDNDGIGNDCDPTPNGPSTPPYTPTEPIIGYVSAETYYNKYCAVNGAMTYGCGLALGIKEALNETKPLFANTVVYDPVTTYYKVSKSGNTISKTDKAYCDIDSNECYITIRSVANDFAMRQANISYLISKQSYIDELIADYPALSDYYTGYKAGCAQGFWFSNDSLPVFQLLISLHSSSSIPSQTRNRSGVLLTKQ